MKGYSYYMGIGNRISEGIDVIPLRPAPPILKVGWDEMNTQISADAVAPPDLVEIKKPIKYTNLTQDRWEIHHLSFVREVSDGDREYPWTFMRPIEIGGMEVSGKELEHPGVEIVQEPGSIVLRLKGWSLGEMYQGDQSQVRLSNHWEKLSGPLDPKVILSVRGEKYGGWFDDIVVIHPSTAVLVITHPKGESQSFDVIYCQEDEWKLRRLATHDPALWLKYRFARDPVKEHLQSPVLTEGGESSTPIRALPNPEGPPAEETA
jgi:hypothetical protein